MSTMEGDVSQSWPGHHVMLLFTSPRSEAIVLCQKEEEPRESHPGRVGSRMAAPPHQREPHLVRIPPGHFPLEVFQATYWEETLW